MPGFQFRKNIADNFGFVRAPRHLLIPYILVLIVSVSAPVGASAAELSVTIRHVDQKGVASPVGELILSDSKYGLLIIPNLQDLEPGPLATHVHENPSCDPVKDNDAIHPGGKSGGHLDPENTGMHLGPYAEGHLGDLPNLIAEADGTASIPMLAPRVKTEDLHDRAIVIHWGADRYSGHQSHLHGKGGKKMYCGIIE